MNVVKEIWLIEKDKNPKVKHVFFMLLHMALFLHTKNSPDTPLVRNKRKHSIGENEFNYKNEVLFILFKFCNFLSVKNQRILLHYVKRENNLF